MIATVRPVTDWDAAYANRDSIPGADAILERWPIDADQFRAQANCRLDIPYGSGERHALDLFLPREGEPKGLHVFVHGGYWLRFDRKPFSQFAAGSVERGWAVALPSYDLCPSVTIGDIEQQIANAIAEGARQVDGPIVLSGHSAGGHLVTMTSSSAGSLPSGLYERVKRVISISGVHDLRPLLATAMKGDLGLTLESARRWSPALHEPGFDFELVAWVGAEELGEFRRQNRLLADAWTGLGQSTVAFEAPGLHHFSVIDDLRESEAGLTRLATLDD